MVSLEADVARPSPVVPRMRRENTMRDWEKTISASPRTMHERALGARIGTPYAHFEYGQLVGTASPAGPIERVKAVGPKRTPLVRVPRGGGGGGGGGMLPPKPPGGGGTGGGMGGGGRKPDARQIATEIITGARRPTAEDAELLREHLASAPFSKAQVKVPTALRRMNVGGAEIGPKATADVVHLAQRLKDEQWADGTTQKEYIRDLHQHCADAGSRVVVYDRRGGQIIGILAPTTVPDGRRGLKTLPMMYIVYSVDRAAIISGYQASAIEAISIPESAIWFP